jgi:hypothetical protein
LLDLADALTGEPHDLTNLLQRCSAPVGHVKTAALFGLATRIDGEVIKARNFGARASGVYASSKAVPADESPVLKHGKVNGVVRHRDPRYTEVYESFMTPLPDEERTWLKELQESLWPETRKNNSPVKLEAHRQLKDEERDRVFKILDTHLLVVEMFSSNMFGGYGIAVYDHEPFPHAGPLHLLTLTEDNLPPWRTRFERIEGKESLPKKVPGCGRDDAWELFSKYTHTPQMKEWIKQYKLNPPREQSYYDY